ncbi:MAG: UDP-N-acetylglucosamine--N-acetylmuramyl-(pentapeptide) pyrophosphoryl-undecaprenol N-acetylglucosamine transferase [Rickettsiales bacterium]|jgi:UDP-N-acetylglucosamine--N-acetylmuramyl-(pentapeptide) pyrophosphoryl-undecaprenol N-acetylglucosamine transferase|nr:UDP-N-acetylglucosamine--N-acetylmuramyl-(pentapeptide) pyrophosphoryl-undecaprenol N-acetylglucosamine transferase [Rickettsiales bacterium]
MISKRVIITSGGTGGHIFPAIILGKKLTKEGSEVLFLGDKRLSGYIKGEKVLPFVYVSSGTSLREIKSLWNIVFGVLKSLYTIFKFKPDVIVGFGCYATLPILLAGVILRKKIFIHEQNSHIGKVNKFFSSRAKYIFTSFYEMYGIDIKDTPKIEFTGNLVRDEIKQLYNLTYEYPSENEKFNILITSGSGGASFFAERFINIFKYFPDDLKNKICVIQQVKLKSEIDIVKAFYEKHSIEYETKEFFVDMPQKIKSAHLVVARSGVGTMSELAIAGKPTIFIPSPTVADNHQFFNADFYRKNGACILLEEKCFDEKNFSKIMVDLIQNSKQLKDLSKNIRSFACLDAEDKIYNFIMEDFS